MCGKRMGSKKFPKPASYPDIDAELQIMTSMLDKLSMTHEIWKEFPLNSRYEVSNYGRLRLVPVLSMVKDGYIYITPGKICALYERTHDQISYMVEVGDKKSVHSASYLVAMAYVQKPLLYSYVVHKDGCHFNNHVDNIMWSTTPEPTSSTPYPIQCIEEGRTYDDILDICIAMSLDPAHLIHAIINNEEYEGRHFKKDVR